MSILIDTNIFLWAAGIDGRLNKRDEELLSDQDVPIFVSAATAWEIAIKWSKGRLTLPERPDKLIENVLSAGGFSRLSVSFQDACEVAFLPKIQNHKDPFDRLLVVQAKRNGLRLMTADRRLAGYGVDVVVCRQNR